ncbi:DNA primase/helicase [Pseudomonas phage Dolphis]|nr:DNA primase/helicase [Pseudomonas phage Dolphis]
MDNRKIPAGTIDKARSDIVAVVSKYVELKKHGSEYKACCPFHKENTPSFSVVPEKNMYYCFGCGAGGDAIDFVSDFESVGFRDAVRRIVGDLAPGAAVPIARQTVKKDEKPEWVPVVPVPADVKQRPADTFNRPKGDSWEKLVCSKRWAYHDANGDLIGYICRFELPGGGKDVIPQTYCVNTKTGEMRWKWLSFDRPRPLYGLDKLAKHPLAQVIIKEGEKAADAAQSLYEAAGISRDKLVVISWPGGGKAARFVDWSPLQGRSVALWPDADQKPYPENHPQAGELMPFLEQPGTSTMVYVGMELLPIAKGVKVITPPEGVPDGWDLADELPDGFSLLAHTKAAALPYDQFMAKHAVAQTQAEEVMPWDEVPAHIAEEMSMAVGDHVTSAAPVSVSSPAPSKPALTMIKGGKDDDGDEHGEDELTKNGYFTILGYDGDDYYFFHHEKRQVLRRTKSDFGDTGLIELAPVNWWEEYFPGGNTAIDKKAAVNWIFRTANSRGIYDPTRVRGRGAWRDKGRHVYHHGSYLTVDGMPTDITKISSGYVYPMARRMPEPADTQLTDEEGANLVRIAKMVRWTMPASAALMAGWVILAPICGALPWRPHIWITGGPGSGKTTVQNKYCAALVRGIGVYAQGDSTEPGIRQKLKADALPVLIDEAESNNDRDKQRMESIIGLIRKTSSESQAETLKGTATGDSQNFHIRSMFCLSSINTNMPTKADIDRLTRLVIKSPDKTNPAASEAHWAKLEAELNGIDEDSELPSRILARALNMLPTIMENIKVFRKAAAQHFGTQRDGDQFGTLLAGCWSLMHTVPATEFDALNMIGQYDFNEHVEDHDQDDATRALEAILGAKLRVGTTGDWSVYELIREVSPMHAHKAVDNLVADATLRRHGIRVELSTNEVWFGTSVNSLMQLVKDMPFVTDLRGQLLRVPGAKRVTAKKFNGATSKVVGIPLLPLLDEMKEGTTEELPI